MNSRFLRPAQRGLELLMINVFERMEPLMAISFVLSCVYIPIPRYLRMIID